MDSRPGQADAVSRLRRAFYAVSGIVVVMIIGTVGFREIEGMTWVNSFYFESMLATGQGPPITLASDAGKIFASVMAFASITTVFTALVVTLMPIISQLWREGLERAEKDVKGIARDVQRDVEARKDKGS